MTDVLNLYKPVGLSPLQLIKKFLDDHPEYNNTKLGYAGRLDPMADGVLLVLVGEKNKERRTYETLPKAYSFDLLFGMATDTYDTLGIITRTDSVMADTITQTLPSIIAEIKDKSSQAFPPYSSRTVNGHPLYFWARQKRLHEIQIPTHPIQIHSLTFEKLQEHPAKELHQHIVGNIKKVQGDFRQEACITSWDRYFSLHNKSHFVATFSIVCSSGTYIRSICDEIGTLLGFGGIALRITRTRVGKYSIENSLRLSEK